jgi:hypothetical protein
MKTQCNPLLDASQSQILNIQEQFCLIGLRQMQFLLVMFLWRKEAVFGMVLLLGETPHKSKLEEIPSFKTILT